MRTVTVVEKTIQVHATCEGCGETYSFSHQLRSSNRLALWVIAAIGVFKTDSQSQMAREEWTSAYSGAFPADWLKDISQMIMRCYADVSRIGRAAWLGELAVFCIFMTGCGGGTGAYQGSFEQTFGGRITAAQRVANYENITNADEGRFRAKVVVCYSPGSCFLGLSDPDRWPFLAKNDAEVGSVVLIQARVEKIGEYKTKTPFGTAPGPGEDAYRYHYHICAVDAETNTVRARTIITQEPAKQISSGPGRRTDQDHGHEKLIAEWIKDHLDAAQPFKPLPQEGKP